MGRGGTVAAWSSSVGRACLFREEDDDDLVAIDLLVEEEDDSCRMLSCSR